MSSFYNWSVSDFDYHNENGLYALDTDLYIKFDDKRHEYCFKIHKGFRTDGGSIPKAFEWLVGKGWNDDNLSYSATFILHDALYGSELVAKCIADDILRSSLRDCGISRFKASSIHRAVMTFAKKHYGKQYDKWNKDLPCHGVKLDYMRHL